MTAGGFTTETTFVIMVEPGVEMVCPFCEESVTGSVSVTSALLPQPVETNDDGENVLPVTVVPTITGMKIDHRCGTYAAEQEEQ